jgi:hypothetical protein
MQTKLDEHFLVLTDEKVEEEFMHRNQQYLEGY